MKNLKITALIFLIFFFQCLKSFAETSESVNVNIVGNKLISKATIINILGSDNLKKKIELSTLNSLQKKLFESNFFSKVDFNLDKNTLNINVVENPLVDFVIIEGLEDEKDYKNFIEKNLSLRSETIYSDFLINKDLAFIKEFLLNLGFFSNEVSFQVKKIQNDRVNIFFNIKLKNKYLVKKIFFIGDKKFSSSILSDYISTTQHSWFKFLSSTTSPSPERLNTDIQSLKNFYLTEGYYDIQIANASIDVIDDKFANIIFSINAGNKYTLDDYIIENNLKFLKEDQIKYVNNLIKTYIKKIYNYKDVNELTSKLEKYFDEISIFSNIKYSISKKSIDKLVINFNIEELIEKKIINNILISGNDITDEKVIRNNLSFVEGDLFFLSSLNKSKDNLQALNIFKKVDLSHNVLNNSKVDVKIIIQEKPTGEISSGIGVSSANSSVTFNLKENNFLGEAIYVNTALNIGTQQSIGSITFSNPDFAQTGNTFKNSSYITKNYYDKAGYENKIIGNTSSYKYEIFKNINLENGLGFAYDSIDTNSGASALIATQEGNYITTKYFYNIVSDNRNKKFKPTSGYTLGFGQDISFYPSDIPSLGNSLFGSYYKYLLEDFTGSIKYKIKSINSLNSSSIKLSDRLFTNDSDLRGFSNRGIGPKVSGDYIGGNYMYSTTVSTTVPNGLPEAWNASTNIFLDVANVWGSDIAGVLESNTIRSAIGIGFTWISPLGPISMSYATPISKNENDNVQNFNFSLGGAF